MDPTERWRHMEKLFHAALNYDPPARSEFLKQACTDDPELLKEVQSLLDSAEKPLDFVPDAVAQVAQKMSVGKHGNVGCCRQGGALQKSGCSRG